MAKTNMSYRRWVFTYNNPNETLEELKNKIVNGWATDYLIIGDETGKKGTRHYQGYVEFKHQTTFDQMKERLPKFHIEQALGSGQKNRIYCSKSETFVEFGNIKATPQTSDVAGAVLTMMTEQELHPLEIAKMFNEYADYIIKNYKNLTDIYATILRTSLPKKDPK